MISFDGGRECVSRGCDDCGYAVCAPLVGDFDGNDRGATNDVTDDCMMDDIDINALGIDGLGIDILDVDDDLFAESCVIDPMAASFNDSVPPFNDLAVSFIFCFNGFFRYGCGPVSFDSFIGYLVIY